MTRQKKAVASNAIPLEGFLRLPQVLSVFPISASSWWSGIRDGRYPAGVKLSTRVTAWRAQDVRALIERESGAQK